MFIFAENVKKNDFNLQALIFYSNYNQIINHNQMNNIANISQINTQKQKNIIKIEFMCHFKYKIGRANFNRSHLAHTPMKCKNCGKLACNKHMKSDQTLCINCTIKKPNVMFPAMCTSCGNICCGVIKCKNYICIKCYRDKTW